MTKQKSDAFLPSGGLDDSTLSSTLNSRFTKPAFTSTGQGFAATVLASNYNLSSSIPRSSSYHPPGTSPPTVDSRQPPAHGLDTAHHTIDPWSYPQRPHSLSPTTDDPNRHLSTKSIDNHNSSAHGPSAGFDAAFSSAFSRSVSADAVAPRQTSAQLAQRLAQQNALIREAWEAERNYLEANRRRADEVYLEERAIMEDERDEWHHEREGLLRDMQSLRDRIQQLEGENTTLKTLASQSVQVTGVVSPGASHGGDSVDLPADSAAVSNMHDPAWHNLRDGGLHSERDGSAWPLGRPIASHRPRFASPGSSRTSPIRQPEASSFIPLDPRTQPEVSVSHDFLSPTLSSQDLDGPIPIIDIQEIDPKLDGIPIKASAVQRSTFSETSNASSAATSPPSAEGPRGEHDRPAPVKRGSSKEHTIQALSAGESRRRTMHAGHTPNHSISLFPTMTLAEGASTNGHSEGATPTGQEDPVSHEARPDEEQHQHQEPDTSVPHADDNASNDAEPIDIPLEDIMEPADDVPLKGPLMIKNIPAQDELFWEQVNKKLEPISNGQNALPTVMQDATAHEGDAPPASTAADKGGDAACDEEDTTEPASGGKALEPDVKLKFKTTSNFGAPFGWM